MYIETRYYDNGKASARAVHVSETISNELTSQLSAGHTVDITNHC